MTGGVTRVVPLTFGWEDLPKTISIHGSDPTIRLREPVPGVLLELDGGWMLLDTGFNDPIVRASCRGSIRTTDPMTLGGLRMVTVAVDLEASTAKPSTPTPK